MGQAVGRWLTLGCAAGIGLASTGLGATGVAAQTAPQPPAAAAPAPAPAPAPIDEKVLAKDIAAAAEDNGRQKFGGLEFGVGISLTIDIGSNDRVSEAELVNGIVRVKDSDNSRARLMLESHYFFKNQQPVLGLPVGDVGFGPFMALQPGTDEIIEAVALGAMIGFRKGTGSESFNIGIGMIVDPNTRILGDGLKANGPLPTGETEIRYKEEPQTGVVILASFAF